MIIFTLKAVGILAVVAVTFGALGALASRWRRFPRSAPRRGLAEHHPETLMALADATREKRSDQLSAEADAMFAQWELQFRNRT